MSPLSARGRKVALIHVGGTIGMSMSGQGWVPDATVLDQFLNEMPQLKHPDVPAFEVFRCDPLLDSANMRPDDWVRIAGLIMHHAPHFDAFVVLHGTDTLAYTASALSFLLSNVDRPIILTGAQLSLTHVLSDGRDHVLAALVLAGALDVPEVCVYFGERLLRGNRTQKISNDEFVAFESGNLPPLATVGASIKVNRHLVRRQPIAPMSLRTLVRDPQVVALRVFPGMTARLLDRVLSAPTEAVVLETYGTGNFPIQNQALLAALAAAIARGVVVVNVSQCHRGRVQQDAYGTGSALGRVGVISGADMTPEAALTKLYCLLGQGLSPAEVSDHMRRALAGEFTFDERTVPVLNDEGMPVVDL